MNKKGNTVIFMIVATILNIVLLAGFFILGFVLLTLAVNTWPSIADSQISIALLTLLVFVVAIGLTFVLYSKIIGWANKKFMLEDNLYPFFSRRKK